MNLNGYMWLYVSYRSSNDAKIGDFRTSQLEAWIFAPAIHKSRIRDAHCVETSTCHAPDALAFKTICNRLDWATKIPFIYAPGVEDSRCAPISACYLWHDNRWDRYFGQVYKCGYDIWAAPTCGLPPRIHLVIGSKAYCMRVTACDLGYHQVSVQKYNVF